MDVLKLVLVVSFVATVGCAKGPVANKFSEYNTSSGCGSDSRIPNSFLVRWKDGRLTTETSESADLFVQDFLTPHDEEILSVEFNKRLFVPQASVDSTISVNGGSVTPNALDTWGQYMVEAPAMWSQGVKGQGAIVGVVDANVNYYHPQIFPRLLVNTTEQNGTPGVDNDGNGYVGDVYGWDFNGNRAEVPANERPPTNKDHGTHVAGIIAADHNSGFVLGLAPSAKIVPANFMGSDGSGNLSNAIKAINYVVQRGARVINASWGGCFRSQALADTIAAMAAQNVLFVAASGNEGADLDSRPEYPAAFGLPNQLTVAATGSSDRQTIWSNSSFSLVHLSAPGENILSTIGNNSSGYMDGTSMAAPYVSGAAALLLGVRPNATYAQLKQALLNSVDVKDYRTLTRGRLNVRKAVDEIKRLVP